MPQISISIQDLVSMIDRGELRLPEMQRRYGWRNKGRVSRHTTLIGRRHATAVR